MKNDKEEHFCSICNVSSYKTNRFYYNTKYGKNLCNKHYIQLSKYGKIVKRTIFDKNEIIIYDNYAEMVLYNKDSEEIAKTKIDIEDVNKIKNVKWALSHNYVVSTNRKHNLRLHVYLLEKNNDLIVDHINGNTLDNQKSNLRHVDFYQNSMNTKKTSRNTSGFTGVDFNKQKQMWRARIRINGKDIHLGLFTNKNDAIEARRKGEIKYFGEFRRGEQYR